MTEVVFILLTVAITLFFDLSLLQYKNNAEVKWSLLFTNVLSLVLIVMFMSELVRKLN